MSEPKQATVGELVIFHDATGKPFPALVTAVWSQTCINVVFVSDDESKKDQYGRQIERKTSVTHVSMSGVHGNYFRFEDEKPNEYVPPVES